MIAGELATEDYELIRRLVYENSRINLGHDKVELVRSRLQKRLRSLGMNDFRSYCRLLSSAEGEDELGGLVDVISTNVTSFFREWRHFEFLRDHALPGLVKRQKRRSAPLRAWSAACSSGEEPYSLAILMAEHFRPHGAVPWQITATDISTRMLASARQGVYAQERVSLPEPAWLRSWFQKGVGQWAGYVRIKPELRERVEFHQVNLTRWPYPFREPFDIILCRNVMIYFDRKTQEELIPKLAQQLTPGGWLLVGHSESLVGIEHGLKCIRPSIYEKC